MNLSTLKTKLKIENTNYDVDLQSYLDFILPYLNGILGVDLAILGTTQVKIFKESYLNSKIVPIEAWKSITQVEKATKSTNLNWITLVEYSEFEFEESITIPNTKIALKSNSFGFFNSIVRITGTYGFGDTFGTNYPVLVNTFILEGARQYLQYIKAKGQVIESERSDNLSIKLNLENVLSGLGTLDPNSNINLAKLIKNYKVTKIYPFK